MEKFAARESEGVTMRDMMQPVRYESLEEIAYEVRNLMSEARIYGTKRLLMVGKLLKPVKENARYQEDGCGNFEEWCVKTFGWKKTMGYQSVQAYDKYVEIMAQSPELLDVFPTRAVQLLPLVSTDEDTVECLHVAKELSDADWKLFLRSRRGQVLPEQCQHPEDKQTYLCKCQVCGKTYKWEDPDATIDVEVANG